MSEDNAGRLVHKVVMTQEKIDRYGKLNGDWDILHYDHDYCVKRGFREAPSLGPARRARDGRRVSLSCLRRTAAFGRRAPPRCASLGRTHLPRRR